MATYSPEYLESCRILAYITTDIKLPYLKKDNQINVVASFSNLSSIYHPQVFDIDIRVHPDLQGNGYGKDAYNLETFVNPQYIDMYIEKDDWANIYTTTDNIFIKG